MRAREERRVGGGGRALPLEPADLRQLRLRLLRLRLLGAEPLDEPLEPGDVVGDALGRLLRVRRPLRLLAPPGVPRPGEERRAAGLELERRARDRLEEPAVVRDEDDRGVERRELGLEPLEARDVEVVRRLVEQQQVGIAAERARERGARQLAAGERLQAPVELVVVEAEPAQDGRLRARASRSRRRARAGPAPRRSGAASPGRASPAAIACSSRRSSSSSASRSAAPPSTYSRSVSSRSSGGRWSWSATRVPFSNASSPPWSSVSPARIRSSVVLPAPFGPESATRSRRSTRERDAVEERVAAELLAQVGCDQRRPSP